MVSAIRQAKDRILQLIAFHAPGAKITKGAASSQPVARDILDVLSLARGENWSGRLDRVSSYVGYIAPASD
jgi:hypothetical protein